MMNESLLGGDEHADFNSSVEQGTTVGKYDTRLPCSLKFEAPFAYFLGPLTGILLLVLEQKNDYVRFHAWQSTLFFGTTLLLHFIFIWQAVVSWLIFAFEIICILFLMFRAYSDSNSLYRFKVPGFGHLASKWVDDE
eukprot:Colp12_sorted_trinity150504_noHs@33013